MSEKQIEQAKHTAFPKLKWSVNKYRRDKRTGPISPVKASKYYQYLSKIGAGWNE